MGPEGSSLRRGRLLGLRPDDPSRPIPTFTGKERCLSDELAKIYAELALLPARFNTPFRSLFFCGGVRGTGKESPKSLRDYLFRKRGLRLKANIVFAEDANQIYRETKYTDLITFEEDIARIVSSVVVIVESPGSYAELGAFAMNPTISQSLRAIVQTKFSEAESFIRFGPIEKMKHVDDESVAFFPWETKKTGGIVAKSVEGHFSEIKRFINAGIEAAPKSPLLDTEYDVKKFYVIYWALYQAHACSLTVLLWAVKKLLPSMTPHELRRYLYCLRLVGWIDRESYGHKDFYFALSSVDPVSYNYPKGTGGRDPLARRLAIRKEFEAHETIPKHISGVVKARREAAK